MQSQIASCSQGLCGIGEWWEVRQPFRHFRAKNVLTPPKLESISSKFREILSLSDADRHGPYRLARTTTRYDAEMLAMDETLAKAFEPFFSDVWLKSLATFMGIEFLPQVDGGLHSSPKGSRSGWIHTDYCSAWFDESGQERIGQLVFPNRSRCDYFTGRAKVEEARPKEFVRAVTMIYYLCNDEWRVGDGGETALYGAAKETSRTATDEMSPVNNSLLLFECSPHSYHRFISNPIRRRNSIILWLHTTLEQARARWGDEHHRVVAL